MSVVSVLEVQNGNAQAWAASELLDSGKGSTRLNYKWRNAVQRERERETERQRDRETERQRDRERQTLRDTEREREGVCVCVQVQGE